MIVRLFEKSGEFMVMAGVALLMGLMKILTMPKQPLKVYMASLMASVLVGTLSGVLALEFNLGDITSMAIASLTSLLAHDLILAVLNNKGFIGSLLKRAAENLTDKVTK